MTTRAINYLNTLSHVDAAIASGASLLPICPADDVAANEVVEGLSAHAFETIRGIICVRLSPGDRVYELSARPRVISKLKLRRALRSAGLEDAFEAALDANPITRRDWDDVVEIHADDPILVEQLPQFAAALGITDSQIEALLTEASV